MAQKKQQTRPNQTQEAVNDLEKRVESLEAALRGYFRHTHYDALFKV
ncbi:MAG: hypothetical protein LBH25_00395 [Fibromonadaceae bacterium]|jgi:hypothetical protein|nr:hypothetical protein [Fibromonadaceae bacterium]